MLKLFPPAPIFFKRVPHCLAPHNSSPFTAECFILLQLSLVVWQKNWKSTDYVYFQNRAYQSIIRPLWCSLLYLRLMIRVISVLSPRMCCFPSRQGYSEYCECVICVCVSGGERLGMCVCDLFFIWYEWPFLTAAQFWEARTRLLSERKQTLTGLNTFLLFLWTCGDSSSDRILLMLKGEVVKWIHSLSVTSRVKNYGVALLTL